MFYDYEVAFGSIWKISKENRKFTIKVVLQGTERTESEEDL